ncbi:MAG: DUF3052 family protein [Acidimicrobiia bacterium]|nr:DUF3052 family protein [Acidimicrobiia bacterium]
MRVAVLHAPDGFDDTLGGVPDGVVVDHGLRRSDVVDCIIGFVPSGGHLAKNVDWLAATLSPDGAFWVMWPTAASGIATDLGPDEVLAVARHAGLTGGRQIELADGWAGLELVRDPLH